MAQMNNRWLQRLNKTRPVLVCLGALSVFCLPLDRARAAPITLPGKISVHGLLTQIVLTNFLETFYREKSIMPEVSGTSTMYSARVDCTLREIAVCSVTAQANVLNMEPYTSFELFNLLSDLPVPPFRYLNQITVEKMECSRATLNDGLHADTCTLTNVTFDY